MKRSHQVVNLHTKQSSNVEVDEDGQTQRTIERLEGLNTFVNFDVLFLIILVSFRERRIQFHHENK